MSERDAAWTGDWVARKLASETTVGRATVLSPQRVHVLRNELPSFVVGTTAVARLDAAALEPLLSDEPRPSFVVNVPREAYADGSALKLAEKSGVAIGGMGDLVRALELPDVRTYVNREVAFIERGLNQHDNVLGFERLGDRLYKIKRAEKRDLVVVFLNPYELTADDVRTARERYGRFKQLVITNPNGHATSSALLTAKDVGCRIYTWREFFGKLNK